MKILVRISAAFLIITMMILQVAYAENPVDLIQQQTLEESKEKMEVLSAINKSELNPKEFLFAHKDELGRKELFDIKDANELIYGEPYKVVVADKNTIEALINEKPLAEFINKAPYHWEVPILKKNISVKPIGSFTVDFIDEKWQVCEVGGYLFPQDSLFSSNPKEISMLIKDNNLEDINLFTHLRIPSLHADFLYLDQYGKEYFIPLLHGVDKIYGIKNKKIISRDALMLSVGTVLRSNLNNINLDTGIVHNDIETNYSYKPILIIPFVSFPLFFLMILAYKKYVNS